MKRDKFDWKIIYKREFIRKDTSNNIEHNEIPGVICGNVSNASTIYGEVKFNASRGHGFVAERANHLYDIISGKDAKEMIRIIENVFKSLSYDYLLNEEERKVLADSLHDIIDSSLLKDIYAESDRAAFPTEEKQANKMITILENLEPAV